MRTFIKSTLLMLLMPMSFFAQSTVSGIITERDTGMPIPGANIVIRGTTTGTTTNFDGEYTLDGVNLDDVIVISYIGFTPQQIPFTGQETINVQLAPDTAILEEVVLIGYGSTRRQDATGAVQQISTEDFNQGAIVSPEQLIQGKSAGVQITSGSGAPGGGTEIRIRGGSSLSANNSPLIVVDGVPLDQRGVQGVRNQLNAINPNEIQDFVVLKDASATAIYGSRASNGVILITTKKGKKNSDLKFEYDLKASVGEVVETVDVLNAEQFRNLIETTPGTDVGLLGDASTDWQDEIYQTSVGAIHNLTVSQGLENFYYRVNFNHTSQTGVLRTDAYERNALNTAFNYDLLDNDLKLTLTAKGSIDRNDFADEGAIGAAVNFDPTKPVYDENSRYGGFYEWTNNKGVALQQATRNPVALLLQREDEGKTKRLITNFNIDYRIPLIDDLKFNLNAGVDYSENDGFNIRPTTSAVVLQDIADEEIYWGMNRNQLLDFYFNYKPYVESLSTAFDFTVGHSYQEFFISSQQRYTDAAVEGNWVLNPITIDRNALESYFARASFDIDDKYLISGSYRMDGSSRFSEDNRWSSFPAVSLGWKVNNEDFLNDSGVLSELKLRAGYGVTGNQEIGPNYGYMGIYTPSERGASYQFGDRFYQTLRPEEYDKDLQWEELQTYNVGIDFGLFNDRLSGSVDAYHRTTENLLAEVPVPAGANLSDRLITNVGETVSKGLEIGLNGDLIRSDKMNWSVNYNITFQDLEITKLSLGEDPNFFIPQGEISGGVGNMIQIWKKGIDPTTFFVYRQVYDPNGEPIEGAYVDVNGDNTITEIDRQPYKKGSPDFYMGLSSNFNYKDFDFSFTWRGSFGGYMYNNMQSATGFRGAGTVTPQPYYSNFNSNVLESDFNESQFFSDYYVQSADFVKLDNVSIGYLIAGEKVDFRASLTATNVLTITDYDGLDPEISGGIDNNFYPRPRTYTLGLNLTF
ncbi:SusC/RagA family TonB-linked outer membrane protein [Salinimicrobium sp. MT39]|uniref:SusC/RagA family TonB-linked outer membrane protein n=1 Tax=Salinimicrobium profundisediminis TaxID=2994553 RepID=A0A9X3CZL5_9FLAO|nr:SusC/RagA family TonB-linked outer membrane protein [Salinimicrobium profundisediminis]MCX2839651.1 SusC/RagA family TonB-linked outer membrane protein [Salinimicrobium profundisediminis]